MISETNSKPKQQISDDLNDFKLLGHDLEKVQEFLYRCKKCSVEIYEQIGGKYRYPIYINNNFFKYKFLTCNEEIMEQALS